MGNIRLAEDLIYSLKIQSLPAFVLFLKLVIACLTSSSVRTPSKYSSASESTCGTNSLLSTSPLFIFLKYS